MTRHLLDPAFDRVPVRRDPVTLRALFNLRCGQIGTIMDVLQISGHRLCPACEALAIAAGADVG